MTPEQRSNAEREAVGIRTFAGGKVKLYAVVRHGTIAFATDTENILGSVSDEEAAEIHAWKTQLQEELFARERITKNVAKA